MLLGKVNTTHSKKSRSWSEDANDVDKEIQHSDYLGRFHLTSDVWCLPPLDLLWHKQSLYVRHWIIQKRQVMMTVKCTLEIGCFSLPKDCCFLFWCGTRQANSNRNTAQKGKFWWRTVFWQR
jgi:hypothetical protein